MQQLITETIPARVAADTAFGNARQNSDRENARIEHDQAYKALAIRTGPLPRHTRKEPRAAV